MWPFRFGVDGVACLVTFGCCFACVVWPVAEELQVVEAVVVTAVDVVDVCALVGAALAINFDLFALAASSGFDDGDEFGPVVGES